MKNWKIDDPSDQIWRTFEIRKVLIFGTPSSENKRKLKILKIALKSNLFFVQLRTPTPPLISECPFLIFGVDPPSWTFSHFGDIFFPKSPLTPFYVFRDFNRLKIKTKDNSSSHLLPVSTDCKVVAHAMKCNKFHVQTFIKYFHFSNKILNSENEIKPGLSSATLRLFWS